MKIANTLMMFLILMLAAEGSLAASYDDYQYFRKGTYDFEVETQFFRSEANYLSSGDSYQNLPTGQYFELWNVYLKTRYELSRRSAWYGMVDIATANSAGFDAKRTNSSLTDARFGYIYMPYSDGLEVITDFSVLIPANQLSENTDTVINNEGVAEGTALLRVQRDYSMLAPFGYVGLTYRQTRSALMPWAAGAELRWSSVTLGGKLFGYQTVMDDPGKGNKTQRLIVTDRVDGGSLKFYSVNPSLVDSEIYAKVKLGKAWIISVGGGTTLTGAANAAGFHLGANLTFSWDSQPSYYLRPDSGSEDDLGSEKKVPKFKEEINDGVDQRLFEKKAPVQRPRSGNDLNPANDGVATRRVVPTKPTPESTPTMDTDNNEVQIKLKRKKKRKS